jgi:hypothetical protein
MSVPSSRVLSANSLFHFTPSLDNLINILTNEFRPHVCLEDLNVLFKTVAPQEALKVAIPMVCFCDIPLSQTGQHLDTYGEYGIGMTKQWGIQNGIAPVLYTYPGSLVQARLATMIQRILKEGDDSFHTELFELYYDFACFVKSYDGKLNRAGKTRPVRFYDEREWRFVPQMEAPYRTGIQLAEYLDERRKLKANQTFAERSISFTPNDIRYLIVKGEDDILPLIHEVARIKVKYSADEVQLLQSRVNTAEQIRTDF